MKLLSTDYKHGIISLKIDDIGDLWHLTCILSKGDIVSAKTLRRIKSSTDSEKAERGPKKPMYLTIQIEKIDFHEHRNAIKLTGPIISGPNTIQLGTYHSLFISDNTTVTIKKDVWNKYVIDRLKEARRVDKPIMIVVVDLGEADISISKGFGFINVESLRMNLPGKKWAKDYNSKEYEFYLKVGNRICELGGDKLSKIIIGGPGFAKDKLLNILKERFHLKNLVRGVSHSTGITGINEIIKRGFVKRVVHENKVSEETLLLEAFFKELAKESGFVTYGWDSVEKAALYGCVKKLLISWKTIKSRMDEKFSLKKLDKLIELVKKSNGKIVIITTKENNEKLDSFGGLVAFLRYKLENF